MTAALVPGSFDPPTNGHLDVIERCVGIFDEVIVGVIRNPVQVRRCSARPSGSRCSPISARSGRTVRVGSFGGLLVDYAEQAGADVVVKGLRAMTDFDYEFQMSQMNRHLSGIVTLFVATKPEYGYLSSSLVKEVSRLGGAIDALVPASVAAAMKERYA